MKKRRSLIFVHSVKNISAEDSFFKKFCVFFSNQAFLPVSGYRFSKQKTFKFTSHVTEIHM